MFNQHFGNYLLKKKILKPEELRLVLEELKAVKTKLGVLAIDSGYLNALQVNLLHKLQSVEDRKFGELGVEAGFLTEDQLKELLQIQQKSNILLGQVLIDKGFFTYEKYEEVLLQYRQDSSLSDDEVQALKINDVEKIAGIFLKNLPDAYKEIIQEYFSLFIRNIIRFIDDEIRVDEVVGRYSYPFEYLVTQRVEGEYSFLGGFAASEQVLTGFASIYAEENLKTMSDLAKDALGEFLNCQNGLFLSHLSNKGIEMELFPAEVKSNGALNPVNHILYVVPCHLSFGKIDFLFEAELPEMK